MADDGQGTALHIQPNLGLALTGRELSNDDLMSMLEARYRKKISEEITSLEGERSQVWSDKHELESKFEDIINGLIDSWVEDNYSTLREVIALTGIDTTDMSLNDIQYEAHFKFGRWWSSGYDRQTTVDERKIRLAIDLYPGKVEDQKCDDSIESSTQFIFSRVMSIQEEHIEPLKDLSGLIESLEKRWSKLGDKIRQLGKEKENCKYRVDRFRGELIDNMMSNSEEGKATQAFLDGVVERIRN